MKTDVVFVHSPGIYDFREKPIMYGPVSDVVPSTPAFEMYPIGFAILTDYLESRGYRARIANIAVRMLMDKRFDVESYISKIDTRLFALDLHWLPHAHGALEIAKLIKKIHPEVPVVFGGLSSTYYHKELIKYPYVDMVMKGDSTEEPMVKLLEVINKNGSLSEVPNLTWKDSEGTIYCQPISFVPENWDHSRVNYGRIIKSVLRDRDLKSYLPFKDFMRYPIVASFMCRGGIRDCSICGGSRFSYKKFFNRKRVAFREPEILAYDIYDASKYFRGPIFLVGDIQAGGEDYLDRFLNALSKHKIKNMVGFEFWQLPEKEVFKRISRSIKNWSFEISCESQDEFVRKKFGKAVYKNEQFRNSIIEGFKAGAQRGDVYFLTGIPYQTKDSIMQIPDFVEYLYSGLNGHRKKLLCFVAPLAPFVDPGSLAFEKPEYYGYKITRRTLEDHKNALLAPSWKYWLNYESKYLDRDSLVEATYDCAIKLNRVKSRMGAIPGTESKKVEKNIKKAKELVYRVDDVYHSSKLEKEKEEAYRRLSKDMRRYSMSTVCEKRELEWKVPSLRKFKASGVLRALFKS